MIQPIEFLFNCHRCSAEADFRAARGETDAIQLAQRAGWYVGARFIGECMSTTGDPQMLCLACYAKWQPWHVEYLKKAGYIKETP